MPPRDSLRERERKGARIGVKVSAEEYNALLGIVASVTRVLDAGLISSPSEEDVLFQSYRRYQDAALIQVSKWEVPKARTIERKEKEA